MAIVTTTFDGGKVKKPFSWSYSRLKNFEACPKKHWHVDIQKDVPTEESEQLDWGNLVHSSAANRIRDNKKLPDGMENIEKWCQRIIGDGSGKILVEQKLAITKDFGACGYFDKGENPPWFRSIGDVIKIVGPVALSADWKTGKILEDSVQLALTAACVFAHHPQVMKVRSEFIWLKFDASSREDFTREQMPDFWRSIWPRIESLKNAHDTMSYPAKKGGLCLRYCPVTSCPHHGER
jgi:hypothetical protein